MRVVANWNEVEKGARIMEDANAICDMPQAVVMSTWYRRQSVAVRGLVLVVCRVSSSEGDDIRKGRKMELVNDITENRTNAKEPFLAMSLTMSLVVCSAAALSAFWR